QELISDKRTQDQCRGMHRVGAVQVGRQHEVPFGRNSSMSVDVPQIEKMSKGEDRTGDPRTWPCNGRPGVQGAVRKDELSQARSPDFHPAYPFDNLEVSMVFAGSLAVKGLEG